MYFSKSFFAAAALFGMANAFNGDGELTTVTFAANTAIDFSYFKLLTSSPV
jgi:hypothetical protein